MSQNLHVCKICGKKFATFKAVCGHQRIHSSKRNRMEEDDKEIWGICSVSPSNEISNESETFDDLFRMGSSSLSQSFYVCKICGKKFETFKAVCGHQRIHSGKRNRMEENGNEIWGLCSVSSSTNEISSETETLGSSLSLKQSSFLTEIEQNEMNEAAMNIVMFSERLFEFDASRNLPSGDDFMDLQLITMKEKNILPCVESKLDFSVLIYHSGFESSSTCSDVVPQALPSPLTRKLQKMTQSNSSYDCKKCGEKFATSKAVCGHQRIHSCRSNRMEDEENGLQRIWGLVESRACSIVSSSNEISIETETGCLLQESSFMIEIEKHEMSEAAMNLLMLSKQVYDFAAIRNLSPGDDTMALELQTMQEKVFCCVESKLDFSELLSHSGFKNTSTCSDVVAQGLTSHLQKRPQSSFNYKCRICGKIFGCSKALGGHQTLHRTIKGQLARKKEDTEDDNSISISSETNKNVSEPSRIEASQKKKKILHCVESKLNFSELFPHSGFELNNVVSQALLSPLRSGLQEKPQRNSNYNCKICDKSFGCSQALGGHQTLHRTIKGQLSRKKEDTEDDNSLSGVTESEAMKFVSQP